MGLDRLQSLVADAARGHRLGWTLDSTFEGATLASRLIAASERVATLERHAYEAQIVEEDDTEAVYVWRRG